MIARAGDLSTVARAQTRRVWRHEQDETGCHVITAVSNPLNPLAVVIPAVQFVCSPSSGLESIESGRRGQERQEQEDGNDQRNVSERAAEAVRQEADARGPGAELEQGRK